MTNLVTFPGLGLSFEINRVAFTIGGINIYWYGVVIAVGIMLAMVFAFRHCAEFGVDGDAMVDVLVVGVVMSIICARIYYVAMSPIAYNSIWEMLDIRQGGIAIYGGVIGAIIFGGLACKWRKIPVLPMFDLTAMGFLIGQCLGRWGNFFNQEAFGCPVPGPLGQLLQPGGLRLQHHPALGHVQRRHRGLPQRQHRDGAQRGHHRPLHAGPPHLPV